MLWVNVYEKFVILWKGLVTNVENIKKNFGFGCMRLPMNGDEIDIEQTKLMVDEFIAKGFTYFDTAYVYGENGASEKAMKAA